MQTMRYYILSTVILLAIAAPQTGCGKKAAECCPGDSPAAASAKSRRDQGVQVAVVENADLLLHIALSKMRQTPIMQQIKAKRDDSPTQMNEDEWARIEAISGLTEADMKSILVSADLDSYDINNPRPHEEIKKAKGACAVELAKALPFPKLYECVGIMSSRSKGAKMEQIELAGRPVVRVLPTSPKEPIIHASISESEKTLLVTFDPDAMQSMLERDAAGQSTTPAPELVQLGGKFEGDAQFRLMVLLSDAMRQRIKDKIDAMKDPKPYEQQTQMGMMVSFFSPIRNIRNLVVSANAGDALDIMLAGDLDNASEAQQCAHMLQAFIVPMISKSFETTDPDNKIKVDDSLQVVNKDNALVFTLQVTADDVRNWGASGH